MGAVCFVAALFLNPLNRAHGQSCSLYPVALSAQTLSNVVVGTTLSDISQGSGPDQMITLPACATLNATATDDGLPNGALTAAWTVVSGLGGVTLGNSNSLSTPACFSLAGTYVLRLT